MKSLSRDKVLLYLVPGLRLSFYHHESPGGNSSSLGCLVPQTDGKRKSTNVLLDLFSPVKPAIIPSVTSSLLG